MDVKDEFRVIETIKTYMPHMEIFKAMPLDDAFGMKYERVR